MPAADLSAALPEYTTFPAVTHLFDSFPPSPHLAYVLFGSCSSSLENQNKLEARSRGIVCEQELVNSRLSVNAANVSVSIICYNLRLAEL